MIKPLTRILEILQHPGGVVVLDAHEAAHERLVRYIGGLQVIPAATELNDEVTESTAVVDLSVPTSRAPWTV